MIIIERPSPNFDERGRAIDTVILHYTGMETGEEAISRLCDPEAKVSAHYVVEEDGRVFRLVADDKRAWHAGISSWKGEGDINTRSVGVEIVNPGHEWGYRDFPAAQIESVAALVKSLFAAHRISPARVLGHSDVAPARKDDPGEKFPWARLSAERLAIGPYVGEGDPGIAYADALAALRAIGYEVADAAPGVPAPAAALVAFQRRFAPQELGQGFSPRTKAALIWAAAQMK